MKNILLRNKCSLYAAALKLMGVCGVLILFEACYGTPKSAFVPKHEIKNKNTASIAPINQKEIAGVKVK
jgi:hypothetical protein